MNKAEMRGILAERLRTLRTRSYVQLAECIELNRREHTCLDHMEGIASDGTRYQIEFQVVWDDKPKGHVRVIGSLWAEPQKKVHPGLLWVKIKSATVEEDRFLVVALVAVSSDPSFDRLDFAVDSFSHRVGDAVGAVAHYVR